MEIGALGSTQQSGQSSIDQATLAGDFQTFITLLTSQLQNQDPTSPMETNEFTNQLVAFAGVEQQIRINQNLEELNALTQASQFATMANYLGHDALIQGNVLENTGSGGEWMYQLSGQADSVTVRINDADGRTIHEFEGDTGLGENYVVWDGTDGVGGTFPPGTYSMQIIAADEEGEFVPAQIYTKGRIQELEPGENGPTFTIGGQQVTEGGILRLISSGLGITDASVGNQESERDPLLDLIDGE